MFTIPEIDSVVAPYVRKGLINSKKYYRKVLKNCVPDKYLTDEMIDTLAYKYVYRALEQGFQAIETRLNTINNSK